MHLKSSEKDDIEGIDLLARDCSIRFIITKQALQEGWDCSFAYVLCALTKSQSETAMTQLIGRVLRQPYATKTGIQQLDECYVYSFQHDTSKLVRGIKQNLEGEGLGDLVGRIAVDDDNASNPDYIEPRKLEYRDRFKKFVGRILLPVFAVNDGRGWREVRYATDILSQINWNEINLQTLAELKLENRLFDDVTVSVGVDADGRPVATKESEISYGSIIDTDFVTRQIIDIVPNPWIAFDVASKAVDLLTKSYNVEVVASNLVFAIEQLRNLLRDERDRLAEQIFRTNLKSGQIKLYLFKETPLRNSAVIRSKQPLIRQPQVSY